MKTKRKIDQVAAKSYAKLGKKFSLVSKTRITVLQAFVLVAFVLGGVAAVLFGFKSNFYSGSDAASKGGGSTRFKTSDRTAPIVTASVLTGTYTGTQTVVLTANEPVTIYFTTDNSTPTLNSVTYTAPLNIAGTTTLKYFAKDAVNNLSAVQQQIYTIIRNEDPAWIFNSACPGISVYSQDAIGLREWKTSNTPCLSPQCVNGVLVTDNNVTFNTEPENYPARQACKELGGRLPTLAELRCVYFAKSNYGTFHQDGYWSATQFSSNIWDAWAVNFSSSTQYNFSKTGLRYVRCVK